MSRKAASRKSRTPPPSDLVSSSITRLASHVRAVMDAESLVQEDLVSPWLGVKAVKNLVGGKIHPTYVTLQMFAYSFDQPLWEILRDAEGPAVGSPSEAERRIQAALRRGHPDDQAELAETVEFLVGQQQRRRRAGGKG